MALLSPHFHAINETIAYPLDEAATARDDAGQPLPAHLIVDLALRWPRRYGTAAFLASATVTARAVTVTIQADDPAGGFAPLAVLTVVQPVTPGRQYALVPQAAGVGGWIAFGSGAADAPYRGRFTAPAQSRFTARTARPYADLAVTGIRAEGAATALTGLVRLRAVAPLTIHAESREIDGLVRDCAVIALAEDPTAAQFAAPAGAALAAAPSVFAQFAGGCAGRPESQSCGDPQPIEFINGVGPDCAGVLTIALAGCATPIPVSADGGLVLSCDARLADACAPKRIPAPDGTLPDDYRDPPVSDSYHPVAPEPQRGLVAPGGCALDFTAGSLVGTALESGLWAVIDDPLAALSLSGFALVYATLTAAARNLVRLSCGGEGGLNQRVTAEFALREGPLGARHNAQVVLGYQPALGDPDTAVFYAATADYDTQTLAILFYDGTRLHPLGAVPAPGLFLDHWHRLSLVAGAGDFGPHTLTATLRSLDDDTVDVTAAAAPMTLYPPLYGRFAIATDRALALFRTATVGGG